MIPRLWLVGGTVRDHLFNVPKGKDLDFAVEADSFDSMLDWLLTEHDLEVWQSRPEFVTLRGKAKFALGSFGGLLGDRVSHDADFTLCRAEAQYSDGRHPDTVTPASLAVDLGRRDFTVNAVAVDESGRFVDPTGGWRDAEYGLLRAVGHPLDRFEEDPLRMLRAVRFCIKHGLVATSAVNDAVSREDVCERVGTLPVERVREELGKAFAHDWYLAAMVLTADFPVLGESLRRHFPNLWLKATTEQR